MIAAAPPALLAPSGLALCAYAASALGAERHAGRWQAALLFGWLAQALAIVIDTSGVAWSAPSGPHFGFAPALSATLWLVIGVYLVESRSLPLGGVRRVLAAFGASAVVLTLLFPGEVIPPAVARWAPLHWVLGVASYGLFGAAVLHAALLDRADRRMRATRSPTAVAAASVTAPQSGGRVGAAGSGSSGASLPLMQLERLTFRFVAAGFAALTATLLLGWFLSRPWRWEQKTVFSLWAWAVFAGLLAGRSAFGWRGRQATRWLYVGVALLLIAYVGSRFVIEVVLHRPLES